MMKTMTSTIALVLTVLAAATVREASAACSLNGVSYPTGTKVGPYVCQPDGRWTR